MSGASSNLGGSGSGGGRVRRDGVSPAQALLLRERARLLAQAKSQAQAQAEENRAKAKVLSGKAEKLPASVPALTRAPASVSGINPKASVSLSQTRAQTPGAPKPPGAPASRIATTIVLPTDGVGSPQTAPERVSLTAESLANAFFGLPNDDWGKGREMRYNTGAFLCAGGLVCGEHGAMGENGQVYPSVWVDDNENDGWNLLNSLISTPIEGYSRRFNALETYLNERGIYRETYPNFYRGFDERRKMHELAEPWYLRALSGVNTVVGSLGGLRGKPPKPSNYVVRPRSRALVRPEAVRGTSRNPNYPLNVPSKPGRVYEYAWRGALRGGLDSYIGQFGKNNILNFIRRGEGGSGGSRVGGGGGVSKILGQGPMRVETVPASELSRQRGGLGLTGDDMLKQLNQQLATSPELAAHLRKLNPGEGFTTELIGGGVVTVTGVSGGRGGRAATVAVTFDNWRQPGVIELNAPTVYVGLTGDLKSPLTWSTGTGQTTQGVRPTLETRPVPNLPPVPRAKPMEVPAEVVNQETLAKHLDPNQSEAQKYLLSEMQRHPRWNAVIDGSVDKLSIGGVTVLGPLKNGVLRVQVTDPRDGKTRETSITADPNRGFSLPASLKPTPLENVRGKPNPHLTEANRLLDRAEATIRRIEASDRRIAQSNQRLADLDRDVAVTVAERRRLQSEMNQAAADGAAYDRRVAAADALDEQILTPYVALIDRSKRVVSVLSTTSKAYAGERDHIKRLQRQFEIDLRAAEQSDTPNVGALRAKFEKIKQEYGSEGSNSPHTARGLYNKYKRLADELTEIADKMTRMYEADQSSGHTRRLGDRYLGVQKEAEGAREIRDKLKAQLAAGDEWLGAAQERLRALEVGRLPDFPKPSEVVPARDTPAPVTTTTPSQVLRRTYAERIKVLREALDIKGQDAFTQGVMKRLDESLQASAKERGMPVDPAVNAFVRDVGPNGEVQSKKAAAVRLLKQLQAQLKTNPGGLDEKQVQRVQEAMGQEWAKRIDNSDAGIDFLRSMTNPAIRGAFIEQHKGEPAAPVRTTTGDPANPTGSPSAPPPQTVTPADPNAAPTPVPAEVPTGVPLNPDPPAIQALPKELRERLRDYGLGTKTRDEALERLTPAQQKKLKEAMDALDKLDKAAKGAPIQSPQEIAQKGPLSEVEKIRWLRKMQSAAEAQTISDYRSGKKTREEALNGLKGKSRTRVAEAIDAIDRTKLAWGPGGAVAVPEYKPLALAAAINSSVKDNYYGYLNLDAGTIEAMKRSLEKALKENPSPESKKSLERALATLNDQPAAAKRYNQGLDDFARALDREGVRSLPENLRPLVRDALHERLSSGTLDAATQRTYTRVIAALDAEIKGQGAAPARTAGEISAAQRQREKLLSEATEEVGATRRALDEARAAKNDIPTQVKKYGEAAGHIKKLQALETLARGQGEKQIADAIAVLHKALESERKVGFSTGPGAAQANANNDGKVWLGPKPQDVFEAPKGTWEINWNENLNINDGKVVMHLREGNAIDITSIWRGSQPPGAASRMITDCIRNIAGVEQPPSIRISRISENQPTIDALNNGAAPADTVLGKVLTGSSALLGAEVVGWRKGQDNGVWWIEAVLRYPAPNTIKPADVVNPDESPQRFQQTTKRLEATRFDGKNITVRRIDDATAALLGPNDLLLPGSAVGNVTVRELIALTGGLNNSQIAVQRLNSNKINVIIRSPGFDEIEFTITRGPNGVKTARLDGVSADTGVNQQPLIAQVFVLKFLSVAKAQGFESVGCYANLLRGQDGLAWRQGYRTWPALGFDATIRDAGKLDEQGRPSRSERAALIDAAKKFLTDNPQVAKRLNLQPNQINENTRVLDLMYDADGKPILEAQLFWRRNGVSFQAQVDLNNPSSKSYRVFQNALRNFGITPPSAATEQSTRQVPNPTTTQSTGQAGGPPQYVAQSSVSEQDHFQQLIARARSSAKDDAQRVRLDTVLTAHREKGWSHFAGRQALNAIIANPNISAAQAIKIGEANEYLINEVRAKFPVPSTLALNRVWTDVNAPGIENMEQARQLLAGIDQAEKMLSAAFTGRADGVGPQARGDGTIFVWGGVADLLRSPIPIEAKLRKLHELANFNPTVITRYNSSIFGRDMGNSPTSYVYGGRAESGLFAGLGGATPREARERVFAKIDQLVASGRLRPIGTQENPGVNGNYNQIYFDTANGALIRVGQVSSKELADGVGLPNTGDGNLGAPIDVSQSLYIPRLLSPFSATSLGLAVLVMPNVGQPFRDVFASLSPEKREAALESLFDAVVNLHMLGRQHNDLHTSNVLYDERTGRVTIIDFGRIERRNPATAGDPQTIERYRHGSVRQLPFERDYRFLSMILTSSNSISSQTEFKQRYRNAVNRLKPPVGAAEGSAAMRAFQEKREGLLRGIDRFY
jgi:hypothetical protein